MSVTFVSTIDLGQHLHFFSTANLTNRHHVKSAEVNYHISLLGSFDVRTLVTAREEVNVAYVNSTLCAEQMDALCMVSIFPLEKKVYL